MPIKEANKSYNHDEIEKKVQKFWKDGDTFKKVTDLRKNGPKYDYRVFAINMDRNILYDRINKRVDLMIKNGLLQEVEELLKKYDKFPTAMQGLGYKEVVEFLAGKITKEEMIDKIKQETRRYAKRQLTWFRRNKNIIWLDGLNDRQNNLNIILKGVKGERE